MGSQGNTQAPQRAPRGLVAWRLPQDQGRSPRYRAEVWHATLDADAAAFTFHHEGYFYEVALKRVSLDTYAGRWRCSYKDGKTERTDTHRLVVECEKRWDALILRGIWPECGLNYAWEAVFDMT